MDEKWNKERLEDLILNQNLSYEEIGKMYGCTGNNVRKRARNLGIELPQRRAINPSETFNKKERRCINCGNILKASAQKYCCMECQKEYKHKQIYQKVLDGDSSIMRANYIPKNFKQDILEEQGGVCAICGMSPQWNNKPLVFILDHIDGHASNNKRGICPNCDSQLDTYKSKNKNGERSYYRYHKEK